MLQSPTTAEADPFREGLRTGELRFRSCESCGSPAPYAARTCLSCHSSHLGWRAASGRGTLRCVVEVMVSYVPERPAPYHLASIELEEGPHIIARYKASLGRDDDTVQVEAQFAGGQLYFARR